MYSGADEQQLSASATDDEVAALREALRQSEARYRSVVDSVKQVIFQSDARGVWTFLNRAWTEITGFEVADTLGRYFLDSVHPDDRAHNLALFEPLIAGTKDVCRHDVRYLTKDGGFRWFEVVARLTRDAEGRTTGTSGTLDDITDRKQDLEDRQRLQDQLVVADRLSSIGTLAAGVAHEINNPLAVVLANLGVVREALANTTSPRPELLDALDDAAAGAERVRRIVRDLKTFSHAEGAPRAVDLMKVLEFVFDMTYSEVRHRAQLIRDLAPVPPVSCNEGRIAQVLLNLLVNAAHSIAPGRADKNEIRVRTRLDGARVMIEVEDTGCGIPRELLGRIFDPFFTTKPTGSGTGLGLAVCHGIVKACGGEIAVSSEVGEGTRFRVWIPVATAPLATPHVPAPSTQIEARRGRVLSIDDEPVIGRALERMLGHHHVVVAVSSADEALALIRAGTQFDVILCDLMMPVMTGMDFFAVLETERPDLAERTLFLTGGAFTDATRAFLARIPNLCLEKPIDSKQLLATIAERIASLA